jgi:hypothetical protein
MQEGNAAKSKAINYLALVTSKYAKREVTGLVQFGINSDSKTRDKLSGLHLNLAPDFIILDEGKKPDLLTGAALFGIGLVGLVLMLRGLAKPAPIAPTAPNLPPRNMGGPPPLPPR